jgi:hypothetical protein
MRASFIVLLAFFYSFSVMGQSDLLILKKKNRTIQSFFPGSEMVFSANLRYYDAYVTSIEKDSIFLVQYDVRQVPTNLGVYMLDTVAKYYFSVSYKDITAFGRNKNNFNWAASGGTLFGGGILLTTAGLATWIFSKPKTRYYASPGLVAGSAALAAIGYLIMKKGSGNIKLGKKYSLHYINVK